jgi:transposase
MSGSSVVVAIDVAGQHVDVAALGAQLGADRFSNDVEGHTALADALAPLKPQLVVIEATGRYEAALACTPQAAGFAVAVINPRPARDFAKATGRRAKTDRINAQVRAEFAEVLARRPDAER